MGNFGRQEGRRRKFCKRLTMVAHTRHGLIWQLPIEQRAANHHARQRAGGNDLLIFWLE